MPGGMLVTQPPGRGMILRVQWHTFAREETFATDATVDDLRWAIESFDAWAPSSLYQPVYEIILLP